MLARGSLSAAHRLAPGSQAAVTPLQQTRAPLCAMLRSHAAAAPRYTVARKQRMTHVACSAKAAADQMPASLKKIVGAFQMVPDPMARYKQLLFYATKLPPMAAADHEPSNKVEGCVSQVWVKPELREDGKVYWTADSDSQLTKGLAALLVLGLSGCTPQEVVQVDAGFIELLGLKQSLTPSRNNGFLNMLRLMQRKALALIASENGSAHAPAPSPEASSSSSSDGQQTGTAPAAPAAPSASPPSPAPSPAASGSRTPVQDGIRTKLTEALKPAKLAIVDESHLHAGHAAMRAVTGKAGSSGETHFKVEVVSAEFEGMNQVKRQRWVYQLLQDEFGMGLHALSLLTKTPSEAS